MPLKPGEGKDTPLVIDDDSEAEEVTVEDGDDSYAAWQIIAAIIITILVAMILIMYVHNGIKYCNRRKRGDTVVRPFPKKLELPDQKALAGKK